VDRQSRIHGDRWIWVGLAVFLGTLSITTMRRLAAREI